MSATDTKTSPFKMIIFGVFFFFAAIGVVMFALYQAKGSGSDIEQVTLWGTIPEDQFNKFLGELAFSDSNIEKVLYVYKNPSEFDSSLVEALASGIGPDLVLITNNQIMRHKDRLSTIPYESYDARSFKDLYIEASEVLLFPEGVVGLPIAIDPLILYWNRTLLATNQYSQPPSQWGQLFKMAQKITKRGETGNIEVATIALGEFTNIAHAKDIFIAMLLQAGGNITTIDNNNAQIASIAKKSLKGTSPAQDALRFYTEFSNPSKSTYTWSKAQREARDAFIIGDLAMYVGYASELPLILEQNPNLNFDVSLLPQLSGGEGTRVTTYARVYTLAIPRTAYNQYGANIILNSLTTRDSSIKLGEFIGLPSARRDLLAIEPKDALMTTFRNSAIMALSWRDPNPVATYKILANMVEDVVSGKKKMSQAIERANRELQVLLGNNI